MPNAVIVVGQRLAGLVILGLVVFVYALAARAGHWPPSHPWPAIALGLIGLRFLLWPGASSDGSRRWLPAVASALALIAAFLWLASALAT